jgi:hypothetical protein
MEMRSRDADEVESVVDAVEESESKPLDFLRYSKNSFVQNPPSVPRRCRIDYFRSTACSN